MSMHIASQPSSTPSDSPSQRRSPPKARSPGPPSGAPHAARPPPLALQPLDANAIQGVNPAQVSGLTQSSSGGVGTKLKQALAKSRLKRAGRQQGEDWEEVNSPISPSLTFPSLQITTPAGISQAIEAEAARKAEGNSTSRLRVPSKLQVFTGALRRHHALLSNPPMSPPARFDRPLPPPKPPALRGEPSNSNLRGFALDKSNTAAEDAVEPTHHDITPRSSNSHLSTRSSLGRPITPTMIAAQNVAAAASLVPKNVSSLAAKVVGTESKGGLHLPHGTSAPRNSFQMPSSPSISAALSYMQNLSNEDEGRDRGNKRDRRRSAAPSLAGNLRAVPEGSVSSTLANIPPRTDSLHPGLSSGSRTGLSVPPAKGAKRRSASVGDVFNSGFTPSVAASGSGRPSSSEPLNAAQALKSRVSHERTGSSGSTSSRDSHPRSTPPSNTAAQIAASYQYVNAEVADGPQRSAFLAPRPLAPPVHPASGAVVSTSAPSNLSTALATPVARSKPYKEGSGGYVSGAESSGVESPFGARVKSNLKGRLAALASVTNQSQVPPYPRGHKAQPTAPPGSYNAPSPASSSSLSISPSSDSPYSRVRSNSSHTSSPTSTTPVPNPKRLTTTLGGLKPQPQSMSQAQPAPTSPYLPGALPASYTTIASSVASTAGSIGATAGGMAMNLGKKGWDRMGSLWGHRNMPSGSWGGYATSAEDGSRESGETGTMSDVGGYSFNSSGTRMLGTMIRPPIRRGKGAVFGRRLEECVRETRVGVRPAAGPSDEPPRGSGVYVTALVTRCIEHIKQWGIEEEGLFRITGRSTHVSKIRGEFDAGADYVLKEAHPSDLDPHSVSSVFKAYLRELPEPILTRHMGQQFDGAMLLGTENESAIGLGVTAFGGNLGTAFGNESNATFDLPTAEAMSELKVLMQRLPRENYDLLHEICKLLLLVSKNHKVTKMPLSNLLLIFCPSLQLSPMFLKIVIEKHDFLFGDGDMGLVSPSRTKQMDNSDDISMQSTSDSPPASKPRTREHSSGTASDDSKRNRTASIFVPPGFSFTVEAFPDTSTSNPPNVSSPPPIPSRSPTPVSVRNLISPPTTSSASFAQSIVPVNNAPSSFQSNSLRTRQISTANRQPSLSSLFPSPKPNTPPVISGPIPIPSSSSAPQLTVSLPSDTQLANSALAKLQNGVTSSFPVVEDSQPSDSENLKLSHNRNPNADIPQPPGLAYSPPPQLQLFNPSRRSADDWAASVLMAAGGSK